MSWHQFRREPTDKLRILTINIADKVVDAIDNLVAGQLVSSRSEFIRMAVNIHLRDYVGIEEKVEMLNAAPIAKDNTLTIGDRVYKVRCSK